VLELVQRVVVVDGGRVVMDGPKPQVLAALAGRTPPGAGKEPGNVHMHPSAQPVAREPAL
jgi:ATP-binding cassette subfamily C protein LapB